MKKRQRKKNEQKYLPVFADEFNLMTMTSAEQEQVLKDMEAFRKRQAFRKRYKDLKEGKPLRYFFPLGDSFKGNLQEISKLGKKKPYLTVTQSSEDFGN